MPVARAMARLLELGGVAARSRSADVGGGRIHYLEAGPERGAPIVVLLQGAGGGCANWYRLLGPLSRHHRVLSPDLPGFGLSDPVTPRPPLGRFGAEIIGFWLEAVGVRAAAFVSTSFGGLIALRVAQSAPGLVRRLALVDVVGLGRELPWPVRLACLPGLGRLGARPSRAGTRWLFRSLLTTRREGLGPAHEAALIEYLYRSAQAGDPRVMTRSLRLFGGLRGQREILSDGELAALGVPLLVAWGAEDRFLPADHGRRAAALVPGASFHLIPGAGHSPNWEAPEALLEVLVPFLEAPAPTA